LKWSSDLRLPATRKKEQLFGQLLAPLSYLTLGSQFNMRSLLVISLSLVGLSLFGQDEEVSKMTNVKIWKILHEEVDLGNLAVSTKHIACYILYCFCVFVYGFSVVLPKIRFFLQHGIGSDEYNPPR